MQYIDPYALFDLDVQAPEELDRSRLKRAKQKILAEFELSDDIVVEMKGCALDKATALRLLDELEDPVMRRHHFFLHRQPDLQHFLSEDKLRHLRRIPKGEDLGDKDFRKFLSTQLAPVFDKHLSEHLRKQHKPEVSLLLERLDLIDPWDLDAAMRGSLRYLNQNIQAIKAASEEPGLEDFDNPAFYNLDLIRLVNRLPRVYQHVRNRYGEALKDLAVALHNKHRRTFLAYSVICAAAELDMDLSASEHINFTKVELWRRQREQKQTQQQNSSSPWEESHSTWQTETDSRESQPFNARDIKGNNTYGCTVGGVILFVVMVLAITQGRWGSGNSPFSYQPDYTPIEMPDFESFERLSKMLNERDEKRDQAKSFLDSLGASVEMDLPGYELETPEQGMKPYKIGDPLAFKYGNGQSLRVSNASEKDMVFFIVNQTDSTIERQSYIPVEGSEYFSLLEAGIKTFAIYTGKDWQNAKVSWYGELLPGFSEEVEYFPPKSLFFKDGATLMTIKETEGKYNSMGLGLEVVFNGKGLRKK